MWVVAADGDFVWRGARLDHGASRTSRCIAQRHSRNRRRYFAAARLSSSAGGIVTRLAGRSGTFLTKREQVAEQRPEARDDEPVHRPFQPAGSRLLAAAT